jgi:hypothetical protein
MVYFNAKYLITVRTDAIAVSAYKSSFIIIIIIIIIIISISIIILGRYYSTQIICDLPITVSEFTLSIYLPYTDLRLDI